MITELRIENWKSFSDATLYIDPLTVIIGLNAAGKSNAVDAFLFLQRTAAGIPLTVALQGDQSIPGLRGGLEWASFNKQGTFGLSVRVTATDERTEYVYRIQCSVEANRCDLISESLQRIIYRKTAGGISKKSPHEVYLYQTVPCDPQDPSIVARLYNEKSGTTRQSLRTHSILGQLVQQTLRSEIESGVIDVISSLKDIFILDPIPAHMRNYSSLSDQLASDGANIAGVLAAFPANEKIKLETLLTEYASHLPERDIARIYAEHVGKFKTDAMLYCDEHWGENNTITSVDARGMSDGTLRFLAILTALMTRPKGSLLIVEEIDNGLHPSRANLLLRILREVGKERKIDVVVTTHNPAFLDAAGPSLVPFIAVAHRDKSNGSSMITQLEDINQLPKLLAMAPIGKLSSDGQIEKALSGSKN